MNQDEEHLRLLSIFHYACAGMAALFACFPVFHFIFGLVVLLKPEIFGPGNNQPPAFFGLFMVIFASIIILFGWAFAACIAYAGRCLGQRKHYTFCLVMAGVACLFMPFGTVLGVFSIIVLVRPQVKALFDIAAPPVFTR
jgi:hypothetical protein